MCFVAITFGLTCEMFIVGKCQIWSEVTSSTQSNAGTGIRLEYRNGHDQFELLPVLVCEMIMVG